MLGGSGLCCRASPGRGRPARKKKMGGGVKEKEKKKKKEGGPKPPPQAFPRPEGGQRCPNKAIGGRELLPKITPRAGPRLGALL